MGKSPYPKSQNITPEWPSMLACEAKLLLQINAQVLFSSDKSPMGGLLGGRILNNLRYLSMHAKTRKICHSLVEDEFQYYFTRAVRDTDMTKTWGLWTSNIIKLFHWQYNLIKYCR